MREACEREGLADLQDLIAVLFIAQDGVASRVRRRAIGRGEGLSRFGAIRIRVSGPARRTGQCVLTSGGMSSSKCLVSSGLLSSGR